MNRRIFQVVLAIFASIGFLAGAPIAQGAVFTQGDVFAAVGNGRVNWYRANGTFVQQLNTGVGGFTTGMAFDAIGNLYVTNFSTSQVFRFDTNGTSLGVWATNDLGSANESIVFDALGNAYIGQADGTRDVIKRDATGAFLGRYNVATEARGSDWIDLAADQKTLFYTSEHFTIKRFDVSTNTQLPDFAVLTDRPAFALRLLADGGLLVADSVNIKRLNAAGVVIQTYDVASPTHNSWFALNLDPNGTSFWSGDFSTGQLHKFNINSGALEQTISTGSTSLFGVTVFGEVTAAAGELPEPATIAVWAGMGLISIATTIRRKRKTA
jgi:hypothetical protein